MAIKQTKKEQFIEQMKAYQCSTEECESADNLLMARPDYFTLPQWVKDNDWTLGQLVHIFRYHCQYLNDNYDWVEFEELYNSFKPAIYKCFE